MKSVSNPIYNSCMYETAEPLDFSATQNMVEQTKQTREERLAVNKMVERYGRSANLEEAVSLFNTIQTPNIYSWTILLETYVASGHLEGAKATFERMPEWNVVSWTAMLQAYARIGHLSQARNIFNRMLERNVVSWNCIIAAYVRFQNLEDAERLFDSMPERTITSWNIMLSAYAHHRHLLNKAVGVFERMEQRDITSWNTMLAAYVRNSSPHQAKLLYDGMPARNIISYTCMLDGYAKAGQVEEAKLVFDTMPCWWTPCWASMLQMYARIGYTDHALDMAGRLGATDLHLSNIILSMHGDNGQMQLAKATFDGMVSRDVVTWTSLLQAYCSCFPHVTHAERVFQRIPLEHLHSSNACWNVVMTACASRGIADRCMELFHTMNSECVKPDEISFLALLKACSHAGLVAQARQYFIDMQERGVTPHLEHLCCMVDVIARSGYLVIAKDLVHSLTELQNSPAAWSILLAACRSQGCADRIFEMDSSP